MEHYQDERIVCVGCGNSFLFSAAEAAHYAERGLAVPPKRCRECRRARKEQRERGDAQPRYAAGGGNAGYGGRSGSGYRADGNTRMPSHTGDVNEYRSPMQDGYRPPSQVGAPMRGRPRGPRFQDDGNYRAPSFNDRGAPVRSGNTLVGAGRGRPARPPRGQAAGGYSPSPSASPPPARAAAKTRPMFSITCKSCGAESQVPFKPDEGRDVFCQACYRARKPA
jgi:CxxC-x17-CxxC domain-containing protein